MERKATKEIARVAWEMVSSRRGRAILAFSLVPIIPLIAVCNEQATSTGRLLLPPTPTTRPITTSTPEPTPIPDPWHLETAQPGQAFLQVIGEGCIDEKPAMTVFSRFMAKFNVPKIGVLGIIDLKKPGRPNPSILGIVGISDSSGKGRDKRFYNGEAKPEKQFTDYPIPTVKLSDGHLYESSGFTGTGCYWANR